VARIQANHQPPPAGGTGGVIGGVSSVMSHGWVLNIRQPEKADDAINAPPPSARKKCIQLLGGASLLHAASCSFRQRMTRTSKSRPAASLFKALKAPATAGRTTVDAIHIPHQRPLAGGASGVWSSLMALIQS
jgi:hypothetical protein